LCGFGGLTGVFPFWGRIMLREACRRGFDEVVGKLALTTAGAKARIHAKALIRSAKALRHPESNPPKIKPPKIKFSREPFPLCDGKPRKWVEVVDTGAKPNSPAFRRSCWLKSVDVQGLVLERLHVFSLEAFRAIHQVELHGLAFLQAAESV